MDTDNQQTIIWNRQCEHFPHYCPLWGDSVGHVPAGFPHKGPVMRSSDVFFVASLELLDKQSIHRQSRTPWLLCDVTVMNICWREHTWHPGLTDNVCHKLGDDYDNGENVSRELFREWWNHELYRWKCNLQLHGSSHDTPSQLGWCNMDSRLLLHHIHYAIR